MRRIPKIAAIAAIALLCALAQAPRDAYRMAYRNWRETDPNLEREAGAGGPPIAQRADKLAAQAKNYGVERSAYLQALADDTQRSLSWLESSVSEPLPDVTRAAAARAAAEMTAVKRSIDTYASDPDVGIQRVRVQLEREAQALAALNISMEERQKMADAARAATVAASIAQVGALERDRELIAGLKLAIGDSDRERAAWAEYYRLIMDSARTPVTPSPATPETAAPTAASPTGPVATSPPRSAPASPVATTTQEPPSPATTQPPASPPPAATLSIPPPADNTPPAAAAGTPASPPEPAAPPAPRPPAITPVPLVRYTGGWTYPQTRGIYHGLQPESIDMNIAEDSGHASGSLAARFKLPPGSADDPIVRFTFSGDFSNVRNQVFELQSSDGSKGRIELIPGTAFNLLEINFLVEAGPGKIRQGNAVLVKK
jgi:hypothetical protein